MMILIQILILAVGGIAIYFGSKALSPTGLRYSRNSSLKGILGIFSGSILILIGFFLIFDALMGLPLTFGLYHRIFG